MATHVASANGNFTATTTWNDAVTASTCFLNSETGNTAVTTSYVESSAMTPGAVTIDGIAVKIASRAASPTGTISVRLAQGGVTVAGTETTVNVSDLPTCTATSGSTTPVLTAEGGWFLFKFTGVLLAAATAYTVSVKTSSSSQVNLWRDSTAANWSRILRLSTNTSAVSAGDDFIITGEWTAAATVTARTVTMDSTAATDYGNNAKTQVTPALAICNNGTLSCGTSASTNYILQLSGYAVVYNGGTLNFGSSGSEIPRTSTATLQFDCDIAAGDFGLIGRNGHTINCAGLSRSSGANFSWTKLTADLSAAGTSATTADSTGWKSGDVIAFAATNRPTSGSATTQAETATLGSDASGTTLSFPAVTNAHSGTSPTQAEVILLTRNVVIKAVTSNKQAFVVCGTSGTATFSWVEFNAIGVAATLKNGVTCAMTTGTMTCSYCSSHDGARGFTTQDAASSWNNFTVTYCVTWATSANGISITPTSATNWSVDHCVVMKNTGTSHSIILGDVGGTFTDNVSTSSCNLGNDAIVIQESGATLGTFARNTAHSNAGLNVSITATSLSGTLESFTAYYGAFTTTTGGFRFTGQSGGLILTVSNPIAFGNNTCNYLLDGTFSSGSIIFSNPLSASTSGAATTDGLKFITGTLALGIYVYSGNFSTVTGIYTAHTNDVDITVASTTAQIWLDNTILAGTNAVAGASNLTYPLSFIHSQRQDQTNAKHRSYYTQGTILSNSTTFHTAAPSEEMQPSSASTKLISGSSIVACASGKTCTPTVYVRKNGTYNGNAPRLIVKRQDSMGVTSDTVLDTLSVGADTWEALTGTTVAATEDGAFEFVVDCDGTAGSVFVDDITAVTA